MIQELNLSYTMEEDIDTYGRPNLCYCDKDKNKWYSFGCGHPHNPYYKYYNPSGTCPPTRRKPWPWGPNLKVCS